MNNKHKLTIGQNKSKILSSLLVVPLILSSGLSCGVSAKVKPGQKKLHHEISNPAPRTYPTKNKTILRSPGNSPQEKFAPSELNTNEETPIAKKDNTVRNALIGVGVGASVLVVGAVTYGLVQHFKKADAPAPTKTEPPAKPDASSSGKETDPNASATGATAASAEVAKPQPPPKKEKPKDPTQSSGAPATQMADHESNSSLNSQSSQENQNTQNNSLVGLESQVAGRGPGGDSTTASQSAPATQQTEPGEAPNQPPPPEATATPKPAETAAEKPATDPAPEPPPAPPTPDPERPEPKNEASPAPEHREADLPGPPAGQRNAEEAPETEGQIETKINPGKIELARLCGVNNIYTEFDPNEPPKNGEYMLVSPVITKDGTLDLDVFARVKAQTGDAAYREIQSLLGQKVIPDGHKSIFTGEPLVVLWNCETDEWKRVSKDKWTHAVSGWWPAVITESKIEIDNIGSCDLGTTDNTIKKNDDFLTVLSKLAKVNNKTYSASAGDTAVGITASTFNETPKTASVESLSSLAWMINEYNKQDEHA
ncbi:MAG: hypothetical protein NkDv07_0117 [Candidatus Improbicoccus devescovinae]|nr:MAG: hypothetical protein NkDv07_0117 [Candidatus Improbicoccus devescovinae]